MVLLVGSQSDAKTIVLKEITKGRTVATAMAKVGRAVKTYEGWRKNDPEFAANVDRIRGRIADLPEGGKSDSDADDYLLDFAGWRKRYLGYDTYAHQQQWVDVLEGREPEPMEGCEWDPRNTNRVIVNVPPGHSKSSTITVDYATYKICMNPDIRICIISKRQEIAAKFLYQIKQRLTSNLFQELQSAYAPADGFRPEKGDGKFSSNMFYVAGRKADQKDPTVEALGLGSSIYGGRYDLIIVDDCIVLDNADQFEKQITWLESEVESRVKRGKIIIIGTRLKSKDMYSELRNDERYLAGRSPWSYLRQPMVLRFEEDPNDWVTLWPRSSSPFDESDTDESKDADGTWAMWDGPACSAIRSAKPPKIWSLVYMQQQVADENVFSPLMINGCIDRRRKPGPLKAGAWGHPRSGGEGMYTIGSLDPAMSGDSFFIVGKVDRSDQKRWIEQAVMKTAPTPDFLRQTIYSLTDEYEINSWVIEKNAFQLFLTMDPEINKFLASRGCRMVPHYTGANKADPDFGVASLSTIFGASRRIAEGAGREVFVAGSNLIQLPDPDFSPGIRLLIEELSLWEPGRTGKQLRQDGPMALWFWELQARLIIGGGANGKTATHMAIPHMMRGRQAQASSQPFGYHSFFHAR